MSRLQEIDHLLGRCAEELRPRDNGVPDVARIRGLMDDLLDERIRIAGVKEFKTPTSKACTICYAPLVVKRIQPDPRVGGIAVDFTNCDHCDRMRCQCGRTVVSLNVKVCPSGHSLDTDTQKAMAAAKRKP